MKAKNDLNIERHLDWFYPIPKMKILILGTFPPHPKRWDMEFYYPNKNNHLWPILAKLANVDLKYFEKENAVLERKKILERLEIGIENLGQVVERKGESALDRDITIIEYRNIENLIFKSSNLRAIILTGYSPPTSTYHDFIKYLDKNNIGYTKTKDIKAGSTFELNNGVRCFVLNSTSFAAARAGVTFDKLYKQFKEVFDYSSAKQ